MRRLLFPLCATLVLAISAQAAELLPEQAITTPVRGVVTESFYLTQPAPPRPS